MAAALPTFAELAGDLEPRLLEASRLFRARPEAQDEHGAKMCLMGATDAAARENTLRWLENQIASTIAGAEMVEGARADAASTAEWDMEVSMMLSGALAPVFAACAGATTQDPDWPTPGRLALDLCSPATRGEATRLLRDMWWMALQTDQIEARKKPGAFLAGVGIVAEHIATLLDGGTGPTLAYPEAPVEAAAAMTKALDDGDKAVATITHLESGALVVKEHPPMPDRGEAVTTPREIESVTFRGEGLPPIVTLKEHPPMPDRGEAPRLPGARRTGQPEPGELKGAFRLLAGAELSNNPDILKKLGISKSTFNNWLAARTVPRIDVHQARMLAAECARMIADIETAESVFKQVTK